MFRQTVETSVDAKMTAGTANYADHRQSFIPAFSGTCEAAENKLSKGTLAADPAFSPRDSNENGQSKSVSSASASVMILGLFGVL